MAGNMLERGCRSKSLVIIIIIIIITTIIITTTTIIIIIIIIIITTSLGLGNRSSTNLVVFPCLVLAQQSTQRR